MTTDLRTQALTVVPQAQSERPDHARVWAVKLLRDATGCHLGDGLRAVEWATEQIKNTDLDKRRVPSDFGWVYRFPNGYEPSVVNDPSRPFRFEIHCRDLDVPGDTIPGLTSEQVEAKLHTIAALPTR